MLDYPDLWARKQTIELAHSSLCGSAVRACSTFFPMPRLCVNGNLLQAWSHPNQWAVPVCIWLRCGAIRRVFHMILFTLERGREGGQLIQRKVCCSHGRSWLLALASRFLTVLPSDLFNGGWRPLLETLWCLIRRIRCNRILQSGGRKVYRHQTLSPPRTSPKISCFLSLDDY